MVATGSTGISRDPEGDAQDDGSSPPDGPADGRPRPAAADEVGRCERLGRLLVRTRARLDRARRELRSARRSAAQDELTGLPNRRALGLMSARLGDGRRDGGDLSAVLFIDLDGFKLVNDANGHAVGDEVLRIMARRLRRAVRHDDRVFRVGGDEFVCVLLGLPAATHAVAIAQQVLRVVAAPCEVDGRRLVLGASVGVALHSTGDVNVERLSHQADAAMYRAKSRGGGMAVAHDAV